MAKDKSQNFAARCHTSTLTALHCLAGAYLESGKTIESIAPFEHVRNAQVKKLGTEHPSTLATLNNLAAAYWKSNKLDKSIPLLEQSLALHRHKLGELHPNTHAAVSI